MSLQKQLVAVTPMSITLAVLLTLIIVLFLFLTYLELSEPEHNGRFFGKKNISPSPSSMSRGGYGSFKDKCPKYGFSKRGVVQNDGSFLNELNAEITNIVKGVWVLSTPKLHTMFTPDNNTIYPGKRTFHTGDCVTVTYLVKKSGNIVVTQVGAQ